MDTPTLTPAQRRVLETLAAAGPSSARDLAEALDITPVAIRQHLGRLAEAGMVVDVDTAGGIGRPARRWQVTAGADASLPDAHADLSAELLRGLEREGLVQPILERRLQEQLRRYRPRVEGDLLAKVEALAAIRTEEGYLARAWTEDDGTVVLAENHCPLQCAVGACLGLCSSELDLFRELVGSTVQVERTEHLAAGDRRCLYTFRSR